MSHLQQYINKRKLRDPQFADGFEAGFADFKVGVLLKQAREKAGMTQDARETARLELQERLDAVKSQAERNRLGQFATPPELASEIISYADSLLPQRSKIHFIREGVQVSLD
jgi:HTH-type transcriptional regulator / antitoxin HipB